MKHKPITFIGDEIYPVEKESRVGEWIDAIVGTLLIVGFAWVMLWWAAIVK